MTLELLFQAVLRERVQRFLKEEGFLKKNATFRRMKPEVVHMVGVQKSRKSSPDGIVFAVNLGVASALLLRRSQIDPSSNTVEECQWRRRLSTAESGEETWWTIHDALSMQRAGDEIVRALRDRGLSMLDDLSTDVALRDLWLSGQSPGLTDVQRLLNLAILTRELGPADEASSAIRALKQMCESTAVPAVVKYLREVGEA
jgi:hypothetical protein